MDQDLASGIPFRIEVEPSLPTPTGQHRTDVADQEPICMSASAKLDAEAVAELVTVTSRAHHYPRRADFESVVAGDAVDRSAVVILRDRGDPPAPACLDPRLVGDLLVEDLLRTRLRDVHERRESRFATLLELADVQLLVAMKRTRRRPRDSFIGDRTAGADGIPHVEHVTLLTDRFATGEVARRSFVECHDRNAPAGEEQRRRLADR